MKRSWIAGGWIALVAQLAWAGNWVTLGPGPAVELYADAASVDRGPLNTWVTVRIVYAEPHRYSAPFPVKSIVSAWSFDCANKTWALGKTSMFGTQSGQVHVSREDPDDYRYVERDSIQTLVMDYVCKKSG
ncbi:surface-adhesin E family protein [Burkholderia cenocepacia]|uniref:surface-adhesin E family protein n=1 Tax=Burkholderia cenocepacia TaxID=95486 RepID=UPI002AB31C04|nr:surface-adhesin E family protein [Burkholderia cenocepacia]